MARCLTDDEWERESSEEEEENGLKGPRLSPSVRVQLGRRLRDFYAALALGERPVPQHFIELVNRLDQGQQKPRQEKRS